MTILRNAVTGIETCDQCTLEPSGCVCDSTPAIMSSLAQENVALKDQRARMEREAKQAFADASEIAAERAERGLQIERFVSERGEMLKRINALVASLGEQRAATPLEAWHSHRCMTRGRACTADCVRARLVLAREGLAI